MTTETFDSTLAHRAQAKYCEENKEPHFAPRLNCYYCNRNIFANYIGINHQSKGISVESAARGLITSCPHCHHSFCD